MENNQTDLTNNSNQDGSGCLVFREHILNISHIFPECILYKTTGYYCPGCGNTRSIRCLFNGSFLLSVRNNPAVPFLLIITTAGYLEVTFSVLGKDIHVIPRKPIIWYIIIALLFIFYILRNFIIGLSPI